MNEEHLKAGPSESTLLLEEIERLQSDLALRGIEMRSMAERLANVIVERDGLKNELRAVSEQLAEMHYALERFLHWLRPYKGGEWVIPDTVEAMCEQLEAFLSSAAPAGGRVAELEEQLAEMTEIAQGYRSNHDIHATIHQGPPCGCLWCDRLKKALSAAPAGGQVLCRINGGWDTELYGEEKPILWLPHKSEGIQVDAVMGELDERHGQSVIVTVRDIPCSLAETERAVRAE